MRIRDLEKLFQSEETLDQVLEKCRDDFNAIDYWSNLMKKNITNNKEEAKKALNDLTGVFMNLKPVVAIAETEKKNREIRQYNNIRIEIEKAEKKFVSASADKEASSSVASFRRIRNIVLAYMEACEKAISTLQSILKAITQERIIEQE